MHNKESVRKSPYTYFFMCSSYSFSLNPTKQKSSPTRIGLLIIMPFEDKSSSFSSSVIFGSFSFTFCCLYSIPLVLKNFLTSFPLSSIHFLSSSFVGTSSTISLYSKSTLFSFSHPEAFLQVPHFL